MPDEVRYWIKGFLTGNQPPRPKDQEGDLLPENHPTYKKWESNVAKFLKNGFWHPNWKDVQNDRLGFALMELSIENDHARSAIRVDLFFAVPLLVLTAIAAAIFAIPQGKRPPIVGRKKSFWERLCEPPPRAE